MKSIEKKRLKSREIPLEIQKRKYKKKLTNLNFPTDTHALWHIPPAAASFCPRDQRHAHATGTTFTVVKLLFIHCLYVLYMLSLVVKLTQVIWAYGVKGSHLAKRNRFCIFDSWRTLVYFCVQIMLRRRPCICCAVTCKQTGMPLQCFFGKTASKPNETKRKLVWMVFYYM